MRLLWFQLLEDAIHIHGIICTGIQQTYSKPLSIADFHFLQTELLPCILVLERWIPRAEDLFFWSEVHRCLPLGIDKFWPTGGIGRSPKCF